MKNLSNTRFNADERDRVLLQIKRMLYAQRTALEGIK